MTASFFSHLKTKIKKNMKAKLIFLLTIILSFSSCQKYEGFIEDFDYSTTYFAYQKPIRTVFSNDPAIEIGVVLGGKRENKVNEKVTFQIEPEMLQNPAYVGNNNFKLLPEEYYSLSNNNTIIIPKGKFLGTIKLTLNKEKFLQDPLAIENTYALPVRITESTTDQILKGDAEAGIEAKDYTIIVIKYISEFQGVYYHRGQRASYDSSGKLIDILKYVGEHEEDIYIKNLVWNLGTINASSLTTDGVAEFLSGTSKYSMVLNINENNSVSILDNPATGSSKITGIKDLGDSKYDPGKKKLYLNYEYSDKATETRYVMADTLIYRNTEMKLELWD